MMETDIAVGSGLKVTCDRDQLVAKLATVSRVVSSRGSVQVLSGVLMRPSPEIGRRVRGLSRWRGLPMSLERRAVLSESGSLSWPRPLTP